MIEYLEKLLEQHGHEVEALALADEMLKSAANTPRQVMVIQAAILRGRAMLRQFDLAIPPGKMALRLSEELGEWDYFGDVCLFLGTAHGYVGEYETACHYLEEYLIHLDRFAEAARYESNVWLNLGIFKQRMGDGHHASKAFVMAAKTSPLMKNDRYEHGVRQVLVGQLLVSGDFDQVPRLMVACGSYLRHNSGPENKSSRLFHMECRVRFAWRTTRLERARALAGRGFAQVGDDYLRLGNLHLLSAQMAREGGYALETLEHAITSRNYARWLNDGNLENEATGFLYDTVLIDLGP